MTALHVWADHKIDDHLTVAIERLRRSADVCHVAVMPDVHGAGEVCNGVALATRHLIYPEAVGGDLGCGIASVAFDAQAALLANASGAAAVLDHLNHSTPILKHARETLPGASELPAASGLSDAALRRDAQRDGLYQFGTLGRGNHFIEFQADEDGRLWVMVHSGSRAMGSSISAFHTTSAPAMESGLKALVATEDSGQAFLADLAWAIAYAAASRRRIVAGLASFLRARFAIEMDEATYVDTNHNHVRSERHFAQDFWVHRKGAMSARAGEAGQIPGSMGTRSFHVEGRGHPEALMSSSHGAGRVFTRAAARKAITLRDLRRETSHVLFDRRRERLLVEEAPSAYKDIRQVMRAQRELTRIARELTPVLVYKG